MDMTNQIELERLFAKNQTMPRIKSEFRTDEVIAHCAAWEVPLEFALDLLAQMHLHKRTTLSVLVGILHNHFTVSDTITTQSLQACADMIWHAAAADLVDFDRLTWMFVMPLFNPLEGSVVIRSKGKCVEVPLAHCLGGVYANLKGNFVRLKRFDNTSLEGHFWGPIELSVPHSYDKSNDHMVLSEKVAA